MLLISAGRADNTENWPRWRGPHDNGAGQAGRYPATWDAKTNLLWQADLPGKGRYYRLRVVAPDGRQLCAVLTAKGLDCIPARD